MVAGAGGVGLGVGAAVGSTTTAGVAVVMRVAANPAARGTGTRDADTRTLPTAGAVLAACDCGVAVDATGAIWQAASPPPLPGRTTARGSASPFVPGWPSPTW